MGKNQIEEVRELTGEEIESLGNEHIDSVDSPHEPYNTKPPTSGPHIGGVGKWGVHTEQIPDKIQVHNLEDGGVIVHYDPTQVDGSVIDALEDIVNSYADHLVLEPYADMDSPIVLTAWGRIDYLDNVDESRIRSFIDAYAGIDNHAAY